MKSRIFALILALCCLSLLLIACDDEACVDHVDVDNDLICDTCGATLYVSTTEPDNETEAATTVDDHTHVDKEPADEYCDVCGKNIVVVFLPSKPAEEETRVEMEVLTAPADANPSDYIDLGEPKQPVSSLETETEGFDFDFALKDHIVWVEEEVTEIVAAEDSFYEEETVINVLGTRYSVIDLLTGNKIIPTTTVRSIEFDCPLISFGTNSADYTVQNNGFALDGDVLYATNTGIDGSEASYTMTFNGYAHITLYYEVNSESYDYDYLTMSCNGTEFRRAGGEYTSGSVDLTVYAGDTVTLSYIKDGSVSEHDEYCRVMIDAGGSPSSTTVPHGVTVDAYSYYFVVTKTTYSAEEQTVNGDDFMDSITETVYSVTVEKTAYTYSGVQIAKATWKATYDSYQGCYVSKDGTDFADIWKLEEYNDTRNAEYAYVTYDGSIYLINKATNEILPGGSALTFIDRPVFDYATDGFGYVMDGYTLYVYDLSQWLECVYTYTVPGYYEDADTFLLANGNLLLQAVVQLPSTAVSFDLQNGFAKYDILYILIDPADKTATEVEFGYWIEECITGEATFTEKATNVFVVYPVKQSMIDYSAEKVLVVGNDMSVLCELPDLNYSALALFGSDYVRIYNDILNCYEILDRSFSFITYVPGEAVFYESFFEISNRFYTIADGAIQALDDVLTDELTGEYEFVSYGTMSLILRETVEIPADNEGDPSSYDWYYYLITADTKGFKLTKIGKEIAMGYEEIYDLTDFGYITTVYIYDDESLEEDEIDLEASFFNFYNEKGEKIGSTRYDGINLDNFAYYNCYGSNGVYTLTICYFDAEYDYQYLTYVVQ